MQPPVSEAEAEALLAYQELPSWFPLDLGRAMSEIGEIRLRSGDLAGAEDAFLLRSSRSSGADVSPILPARGQHSDEGSGG
jgi:hypothetical protein